MDFLLRVVLPSDISRYSGLHLTKRKKNPDFFFFSQLGSVSYRFYFHSFLGRLLGGQAVPQHLLGQFPNHCRTWRDSSAG